MSIVSQMLLKIKKQKFLNWLFFLIIELAATLNKHSQAVLGILSNSTQFFIFLINKCNHHAVYYPHNTSLFCNILAQGAQDTLIASLVFNNAVVLSYAFLKYYIQW